MYQTGIGRLRPSIYIHECLTVMYDCVTVAITYNLPEWLLPGTIMRIIEIPKVLLLIYMTRQYTSGTTGCMLNHDFPQ